MTDQEKKDFKENIRQAQTSAVNKIFKMVDYLKGIGEGKLAKFYIHAAISLDFATIDFELDSYGPNGAEMTWGARFENDISTVSQENILTVYKGAYEAFLNGSPKADNYLLNVKKGMPGLVSLMLHEAGHSIIAINYQLDEIGNRIPDGDHYKMVNEHEKKSDLFAKSILSLEN